jgi:hypothetical protein
MLTSSSRPCINDDVIWTAVDNEAVVVSPREAKARVLNEVGTRMWELSDGSRTVGEIASVIAGESDVSVEQAEVDAIEFLDELIALELVGVGSARNSAETE